MISLSQEHRNHQKILNSFVFPLVGKSVAMKHLDVLLFSAKEPHCVSTTAVTGDLYCSSLYLKTAVVGENLNAIPVSDHHLAVLKKHGGRSP